METMAEKLERIEEMTANVDAVQERVLADILARNGNAEYLAKFGLAAGADRATFRAKVPVVTYEDVKPYILRVANGDASPVLTGPGHPISEFLVTTGTSGGESKLIPAVKDELDRRMLLHSFARAVMNHHVPGLDEGCGLYFNFVKSGTTTPGGLPALTLTTSVLQGDHFKRRPPYDPRRGGGGLTSPAAAVLCEDSSQSMYAQMLCGLCHRHAVLRIGAPFAYVLLRAVSFLQRNWRHLAADIEAGALVSQRVTDPAVREAVAGVLRPDPDLARFIRTECGGASESEEGDRWAGILTRLWPNAKYLDAICTGTMAQYVPTLRYFSGGGLPMVSTIYGASECYFGLNLRPMSGGDPAEATYTIMPNMAYFEFLPTDTDDATAGTAASQRLVELARVEAGREYELVVTTYGGLYRYRVGDVLRVAGFHNAAPEFRFVRRRSVLLSVDIERTDEAELQRAVARASAALLAPRGAAVLDYTARTCAETVPVHYVVYWELLSSASSTAAAEATATATGVVVEGDVLERCCLEMEEALGYLYREGRAATGSIGALEIRVVRPGTFEEVADYAVVSGGASVGQYKVPRCVTAPAIVELLESRVVSRHLSPALPHWDSAGLRFQEEETIKHM